MALQIKKGRPAFSKSEPETRISVERQIVAPSDMPSALRTAIHHVTTQAEGQAAEWVGDKYDYTMENHKDAVMAAIDAGGKLHIERGSDNLIQVEAKWSLFGKLLGRGPDLSCSINSSPRSKIILGLDENKG